MEKALLVAGLTIDQWVEKETAPQSVRHWGDPITFSPVICGKIIGDGLQLVYIGSIDQRPYYWLIRIDSKMDINDDDFDIETLLEPIEDECGRGDQWVSEADFYAEKAKGNDDYEGHETYEDWHEHNYTYPVIRWDGGHWGLIVNMVTGKIGD